jgi:tryptophan synthase alpha chain
VAPLPDPGTPGPSGVAPADPQTKVAQAVPAPPPEDPPAKAEAADEPGTRPEAPGSGDQPASGAAEVTADVWTRLGAPAGSPAAVPTGSGTRRGASTGPDAPVAARSGVPVGPPLPVERLEGRLDALRREGRAALVAYGVAGYPDLDGSLAAFRAMAEAGADVLEVGPPYSDPLIDGPVIQRAVTAALDAGTRLDDVLGLVNELTASVDAPVVLLVYYNLVAHRGPRRFAAELAAAGACGAVVPDLPPEEAGEWLEAAAASGIAPVFLAAPTSSDGRLAAVAKAGRGFVYAQASLGVTGLRASLAAGIEELVGRVRAHTDLPICAGIGVSNAEQAAAVAAFADGAIVGTALVRRLGDAGLDGLRALTAELAVAVHTARR